MGIVAAPEIFECREHEPISIPIERLVCNGRLAIDDRIASRGYLDVSIADRRVQLRSTKFVGLIPLSPAISVRILPRAKIANLSRMMVKSGEAPAVLPDFARGYIPRFENSGRTIEIYYASFLRAIERIVHRGLLKSYDTAPNPPKWRGRLAVADTIKRYVARGIKYAGIFQYQILSRDVFENIVVKKALRLVETWLAENRPKSTELTAVRRLLADFAQISDHNGSPRGLVDKIPRATQFLPSHLSYYKEALWTAFAILQQQVPDVVPDGSISLDSMIIDVSRVFESYVRQVLAEASEAERWRILDGNKRPTRFFIDNKYQVKPDMMIEVDRAPIAVLDAKYKPDPKEADRYELLAFMEACGVARGAFVCPHRSENDESEYIGTTIGKKRMAIIRFNLAADEFDKEEARFVRNVKRFIHDDYNFRP